MHFRSLLQLSCTISSNTHWWFTLLVPFPPSFPQYIYTKSKKRLIASWRYQALNYTCSLYLNQKPPS